MATPSIHPHICWRPASNGGEMPIHVYDTHIKEELTHTHKLKDTIAHWSRGKVPFSWCHTGGRKTPKSMLFHLGEAVTSFCFGCINNYSSRGDYWQGCVFVPLFVEKIRKVGVYYLTWNRKKKAKCSICDTMKHYWYSELLFTLSMRCFKLFKIIMRFYALFENNICYKDISYMYN